MGKEIIESVLTELMQMQKDIKTLALCILDGDNDYEIDKPLMDEYEIDTRLYESSSRVEDIDDVSCILNDIVTRNHTLALEWESYLKDDEAKKRDGIVSG